MWYKGSILDKVNCGDNIMVITESDLSYEGVLLECGDTALSLGREAPDGMLTLFIEYDIIDSIGRFEKRAAKVKGEKKNDN